MPARDTTFCFTDIAGSTDILRRLGESRYDELLERHRELIRVALGTAGGREVKTEGDGFFVVFDDPGASLRFAVEAQRALLAEPWPVTLRVRMGLHRGPGIVRDDGDYSSLAAHQAARVATAAHGGQVLLTTAVAGDVDPPEGTRFVHLGSHRLRDFEGGVPLVHLAGPGLLDGFPPVRATREDHGLPLPRSSLVGRDQELRILHDLLTTTPMVTLHGPGGVGKTRLALEAAGALAASFPDGLHLVELSPIIDPDVVVATVATALRVPAQPGREPLEGVLAMLAAGSQLLVLDSAERVLDAVAHLADAIARRCPGCTVLVTSTEPVRTPDERIVAVAPLPSPEESATPDEVLETDAVRLLVQRTTARGAELGEIAEAAEMLGTLARRLDGIPLALELAAGRIAENGLAATLSGLDDRFALLTNGWRTALPRHRTLQAMVEWTVSALDEDERDLLARLAGLRGRWRPADALAAAGADRQTTGAVQRLADRSLVWLDGAPERVRMFDTIRAYVEEHLPLDDREALLGRKRAWLRTHIRTISGEPDAVIHDEVEHLLPDIREVITPTPGAPPEEAAHTAELAALVAPWFESRGLWDEGIARLQEAIDAAPHGELRLMAMTYLAQQYVAMGDSITATQLAETVLADPLTPDGPRALAYVVVTPPGASKPEGLDPLAEALRLCGDPDSAVGLAVRSRIAIRALAHGDAAHAADLCAEIIETARARGRTVVAAQALGNRGAALVRLGRFDEAEDSLEQARTAAEEARLPQVAAVCLTNLSMLALHRGDNARALDLAEERLRISEEMGDLRGAGAATVAIANAALALGHRDRARDANRRAYDLFRKLEHLEGAATALFNLVVLTADDGDLAPAARAAGDLARLVLPENNGALHSLALFGAAGVAAMAEAAAGAALLRAAERHRPEVVPLDPSDREWLVRAAAALEASVDAVVLDEERRRGTALGLREALELAATTSDEVALRLG